MRHFQRNRAFTLVELMVVVVVIGALIGILVPVLGSARNSSRSAQCQVNLHQLALAFDVFTQSNKGRFPDDLDDEAWDDRISPYLTSDGAFRCPADTNFEQNGISYTWRNLFAVGNPALSLGGRDKGRLRTTELLLVFEMNSSWHEKGKINAATIDAAASSYTVAEFEENLSVPVE